ncbi:MAG: DUF3500 domain-containing protein [Cyclobacteriaceae bacterium]
MRPSIFITLFLLVLTQWCHAQSTSIAGKANDFLALLDDTQSAKARYMFEDEERFNWHFVPRERNGISFNDLNEKQRQAALSLLKASLSEQGFQKASNIMALENVLREVESRPNEDTYRDPLNYYLTIFGNPDDENIWGWRLEGHHISINFSSGKGEIVSSTPTFWGSNPAIVRSGKFTGRQILKQETDLGFTLVNSLNMNQLKIAVIAPKAPAEIITGNQREAQLQEPKGLGYAEMTEQQKKLFMQLLNVYVKNYQLGFSKRLMAKIEKAGIENLNFAWAGSLQPGAGHYYRIQGPMLLIEYDNIQNNANHVHTAVRDLTNDFAADILKEHYEKEHN